MNTLDQNREAIGKALPWLVLVCGFCLFAMLCYWGSRPESPRVHEPLVLESVEVVTNEFKNAWWSQNLFFTNLADEPKIVFRILEAKHTSDTNGPSRYTAYVEHKPVLEIIYSNQIFVSATLYLTNLAAFSNKVVIYK